MTDNQQHVAQVASQLYHQAPDWVTFFREVLGIEGIVRKVHPTPEAFAAFERTTEYAEIQQMLETLRSKGEDGEVEKEPIRVITVRLPESLHESLKAEAHDRQTSMNQLCISKLLKILEAEMAAAVPEVAPAEA